MKWKAVAVSRLPTRKMIASIGIGIDGDPRRDVAHAVLALAGLGDVPLLGVDERPNLVALDAPRR
jgi:hypothetical protein